MIPNRLRNSTPVVAYRLIKAIKADVIVHNPKPLYVKSVRV